MNIGQIMDFYSKETLSKFNNLEKEKYRGRDLMFQMQTERAYNAKKTRLKLRCIAILAGCSCIFALMQFYK
jgi:hypothetical protein